MPPSADGGPGRAHRRRIALACAVIAGAGVLAFATSFRGVFLFDDHKQILLNEGVHELADLPGVLGASPRPVASLTFALNYALAPPAPGAPPPTAGFHAINLLVHVLAALVLFGLVRRTLALERIPAALRAASVPVALGAALLWVVHPLQTQGVTYIVQRSESLMALFYLLTLYCLLRGADVSARRPTAWFACCIGACALGMGAKAVMVTAPVAAVLFDRAFLAGSFAGVVRRRWWLHLGLAATWGVLLLTGIAQGVLSTGENPGAGVGFAYKGVTPTAYFLAQPGVILHYLRLALVPVGQCLDYDWPPGTTIGHALPSLLPVAVLGLVAAWGLVRNRAWGFASAFFFIVLAPTSSIVPVKDLAFEHRMYLPLASVTLGASILLWHLCARFGARSGRPAPVAHAAVLALLALVLGVLTARRNLDYSSEERMWRSVIACGGNVPRAANNLGVILKKQQRFDEAMQAYNLALEHDPDSPQAHYNIAQILRAAGRTDESIPHYERAAADAPKNADILFNYAGALLAAGRTEDARRVFERVIALNPEDAQARKALAGVLLREGRLDEAADALDELLRLTPDDARAWAELGNTRFRLDFIELAARAYRRAVDLQPADADTWFNLGVALSRLGRTEESIDALRGAVRANPRHVRALTNLGQVLLDMGRASEALPHLEAAAALDPDTPAIGRALEKARAMLNNPPGP